MTFEIFDRLCMQINLGFAAQEMENYAVALTLAYLQHAGEKVTCKKGQVCKKKVKSSYSWNPALSIPCI